MGKDVSRARQRVRARPRRRRVGWLDDPRGIVAAIGLVLVLGLAMGVGGGFYLAGKSTGQGSDAAVTAAEADNGEASESTPPDATEGHPALGDSFARATQAARQAARPDPPASPERADERAGPSEDLPAWRRYAVAVPDPVADTPRVAIIIDDLGLNRRIAREVIDLPAPLTLAFMSYAPRPAGITAEGRESGHELMVHLPMEPMSEAADPGPNALRVDDSIEETLERLDWGLTRFGAYVGINNHMGSAFTRDEAAMRPVMEELKRRGLLFLDSRTAPDSVGASLAAEMGVPHATRDVFLDNDRDSDAIRARLAELERLARRRGSAIAIGHPYEETVHVLSEWIPQARERGIAFVPVSALAEAGPSVETEGRGRADARGGEPAPGDRDLVERLR